VLGVRCARLRYWECRSHGDQVGAKLSGLCFMQISIKSKALKPEAQQYITFLSHKPIFNDLKVGFQLMLG